MTREEAKSCTGTIEMLQRLAYNIHGVMDVIDADNCKKIIKALEQEPCEDAISRQAVLDLVEHYNSDGLGSVFYGYEEGVKFADAVNKLPSVNSQEPQESEG